MRTRVLLLVFVSAILAGLPVAGAQQSGRDSEARFMFEAARVAYSEGRYEDALASFRRSYELSSRPQLLYNIGNCLFRLRRFRDASETFQAYLTALPDAENQGEVRARLRDLETLVPLEEAGTAEAPAAPPGDGDPSPEASADVEVAPDVGSAGAAGSAGAPVDSGAPSSGGDIASEWWFWTIVAVVVVGAGAGITAGVLASTPQSEVRYDEPIPGSEGTVVTTLTVRW